MKRAAQYKRKSQKAVNAPTPYFYDEDENGNFCIEVLSPTNVRVPRFYNANGERLDSVVTRIADKLATLHT